MSSLAISLREEKNSELETEMSFGLARSRDDLSQAFRLVFESYYRAGLSPEHPSRIRLTPHHLLPTTEVLLGRRGERVTSTLTMYGDGYLGLPMQSMYPVEVGQLRDDGLKLAEIGCLADRRESQSRFIDTFAELGRLLAMVAQSRGIDAILAATHPRHARLYKRIMGFRQIGELSDCPYANGNPAVALYLKFDEHRGTPLYEKYFGNPLPRQELVPYRWDSETRRYFRRVLERDSKISSFAGIQGYYNWAVVTGSLTPSP
ncbi:hypothetical protein CA13_26280 [Planctomycetes bacterium CA13]|uniref:N-acyl amino acid synthase FeeM catalytic core domain-containing protein n=1 Tax=Novipirellula herctigrandis TaxID=2527986 RepID=A0A5C5Z1X8_9BACT|nr:hypothetical protein CA13_26280 [Planctomycetes bacterium CA13]